MTIEGSSQRAARPASTPKASEQAGPVAHRQEVIGVFEHLMQRHERRVFTIAWRILGNAEDAEDVAQEVFVKLWDNLHRLDMERPLGPWICRVAVNFCLKLRRKKRFRWTLALQDLGPDQEPRSMGGHADPVAGVVLAEEARVAELALAALPDKQRAAVVLRDLEGLSTREVADVLGSSETTVRSQISRARLSMRRYRERFLRRQEP